MAPYAGADADADAESNRHPDPGEFDADPDPAPVRTPTATRRGKRLLSVCRLLRGSNHTARVVGAAAVFGASCTGGRCASLQRHSRPRPCIGDCDGNGHAAVNEATAGGEHGVIVADPATCPPGVPRSFENRRGGT